MSRSPAHLKVVQRYPFVDLARYAAFASVAVLHLVQPEGLGLWVNVLSRWAVPFFFLISGFFSAGKKRGAVVTQLLKALKMALLAALFYLALDCLKALAGTGSFQVLVGYFLPGRLASFFLLNQIDFAYHLWFLFALVYVYLFYLIWNDVRLSRSALYVLVLALSLVRFLRFEAFGSADALGDLGYVAHSWVLVSLPMFVLGLALRDVGTRLLSGPVLPLVLMLFAGMALSFLEYGLFGLQEMYVGSALIALGAFGLCASARAPRLDERSVLSGLLSYGSEPSAIAYIVHLAIIEWVGRLPWVTRNELLFFVVVVSASIASGILFSACRRVLSRRLSRRRMVR